MAINARILWMVSLSLIFTSAVVTVLTLLQIGRAGDTVTAQLEELAAHQIRKLKSDGEALAESYRLELMDRKKEYLRSQVQTATSVLEKAYADAHDTANLQEAYRERLQNALDTAFGVLEAADRMEGLTKAEQQAHAAAVISQLRYGPEGKDYFWINDMRPAMVMHPYKTELDGQDLTDYADPNGKHLFVEFVKAVRDNGRGFVDYHWPRYDGDAPQPKLSYVRRYAPWDWIIGTGVYLQIAESRLKEDAAAMIASLRYGPEGKDYFWINDMRPAMVMHPYKKELNGVDVTDYADPNGKHLFIEFVKTVQADGEGFVDYHWPRYDGDDPQPKLSFVKGFAPWNWVIGTGLYIDDIAALMARRAAATEAGVTASMAQFNTRIADVETEVRRRIRGVVIWIIGLTAGVLAIAMALAAWLTRRSITRPINRVIRGLSDIARELTAAAGQIAGASQSTAASAGRQAASVEESSASLEQMAAMSRQTSELTKGAEELMRDNIEKSARSLKTLMELSRSMSRIESESDAISKIIKTVDDIAFQTGLLALNAAVEAARAGDAGAGFAVVAEEVKRLARDTIAAADSTQSLLTGNLEQVSKSAQAIRDISLDFTAIIESATILGEKTSAITTASQEQARGIDQLTKAAHGIDQATQAVAAGAEQSAASAAQLAYQARDMEELVSLLVKMVRGRSKNGPDPMASRPPPSKNGSLLLK